MAGFPRAFPPHILGAVAAGELGGFLPIMIGDVALDYEIAQRRSKRLHKWFIGLGWINAVGTLAIAPSLRLMLPEFANGAILQGIIKWLTFSTKFILLPCGLIYVLFLAMAFALRQPGVQPLAQSMVLRVPWVGRASRERSLASFSRILWRLQKAGILPIQAWQAACSVCENVIIASRLGQQIPALRSGLKLSDAFAATGYFTGEDQRVLALGEQTGQSVDVLERISAYYEDAALSSAGSASRLGIHIMVIANILALGIAVYCMVPLVLQWEMQWAEQF
jgi:type II secretory pathway component PulF